MCVDADWNMPPWHPDLIPLADTITGHFNTVWGNSGKIFFQNKITL